MPLARIFTNLLILITLVLTTVKHVACDTGILWATSGNRTHSACILYNEHFQSLPSKADNSREYRLTDLSERYGCHGDISRNESSLIKNSVVAVRRGECKFVEKAKLVQDFDGVGVIVVSNSSLVVPGPNQTSDFEDINITVATIGADSFLQIQELGSIINVKLYSPKQSKFDAAIIVIFVIALFCITSGGLWSGKEKYSKYQASKAKKKKKKKKKKINEDESESDDEDTEEMDFKIHHIFVFVVIVCGMLLALYFLYDYLVYVVIGMFVLAGATGTYACVKPLWSRIFPFKTSISVEKIPCCSGSVEIRMIILSLLSLALGVTWLVLRFEPYAWLLQDILGLCFCVNILKTLRLPSLKVCSIVLVLLFVYDIFFVFITPYFTKNGDSIMVEVATGGQSSTKEKLPMLFIVPRLGKSELSDCGIQQPSMLGFGDVIVPGLLIAYNHAFDLRVNSKKIYFISTTMAYGIGMIVTFLALFLMEVGQPALLYLVPCTLLTTFTIACIRKEFKQIWSGDLYNLKLKSKDEDKKNDDSCDVKEDSCSPDQVQVVTSSTNSSTSSLSSRECENRNLLRR